MGMTASAGKTRYFGTPRRRTDGWSGAQVRSRIALAAAAFLLLVMFPAVHVSGKTETTNASEIVLLLQRADGSPLSNARITVYKKPFNHGAEYSLVQLATGSADASGTFSFGFSDTSGNPEINALVTAIDPRRRSMIWNYQVLPTSTDSPQTFAVVANVNIAEAIPNASELSLDTFVSWRAEGCEQASDPDGVDLSAAETESDPDGPEDTAEYGPSPSLTDCLPTSDGTETSTTSSTATDVSDPDGGSYKVGETTRWVKVADHHIAANGVKGKFHFLEGFGTYTQYGLKVEDGNWQAGSMILEGSSRIHERIKTKSGGFHRHRYAKYVYYKYKHITCAEFCITTYTWEPHHWTGALKRSSFTLGQPDCKPANGFKLTNNDTYIRSTGANKTYQLGVHLIIWLDSRAGYKWNTKLTWIGTDCNGCTRWIFGGSSDPGVAQVIFNKNGSC